MTSAKETSAQQFHKNKDRVMQHHSKKKKLLDYSLSIDQKAIRLHRTLWNITQGRYVQPTDEVARRLSTLVNSVLNNYPCQLQYHCICLHLQEYSGLSGLQRSPGSLTLDLQSARTTGKYTSKVPLDSSNSHKEPSGTNVLNLAQPCSSKY